MNIYPFPWPIGTVHFNQMPVEMQTSFLPFLTGDIVHESVTVHRTATEGPYVDFSGYKVRVMIEDTSPTTYIVRIV